MVHSVYRQPFSLAFNNSASSLYLRPVRPPRTTGCEPGFALLKSYPQLNTFSETTPASSLATPKHLQLPQPLYRQQLRSTELSTSIPPAAFCQLPRQNSSLSRKATLPEGSITCNHAHHAHRGNSSSQILHLGSFTSAS
jgi:hypothetical protein